MQVNRTDAPRGELLIDHAAVAELLGCSARHVRRLWEDYRTLPPPLHVGRLRKWRRSVIEKWIGEREGGAA